MLRSLMCNNMQYREYGKTGKKVSVLGFGAMRLPCSGSLDKSVAILRHAFDLGINYVDTASMYSRQKNENLVGEAIKGRRDKIFIATKNHYKGKSGDEWQEYLDKSLKRLDIDYIDFYHLHALRWDNYRKMLDPNGPIERFRKVKEDGTIQHACFSSHDKPENIAKLIDTGDFDGMLVQYNLLDRKNEELIAYAHKKGMGVEIMGPIAGGRLAFPSDKIQNMFKIGNSTPEVALRFVLSNPNVSVALSGMTSIEIVDENIATVSRKQSLSTKERVRVIGALEEIKRLSDLYCTECSYCMPCPNNVDIPSNFKAMNIFKIWGLEKQAQKRYRQMGRNKKRRWAEACLECGECEPKCPQNIPIRKRLKETKKILGTN